MQLNFTKSEYLDYIKLGYTHIHISYYDMCCAFYELADKRRHEPGEIPTDFCDNFVKEVRAEKGITETKKINY